MVKCSREKSAIHVSDRMGWEARILGGRLSFEEV